MTQGLDQQVGDGMVQVARVDGQQRAHTQRQGQTVLLRFGHGPARSIERAVDIELADLIIGAPADAFNKGAFRGIAGAAVIKKIILQVRSALCASVMHSVAHVAICVEVGRRIL